MKTATSKLAKGLLAAAGPLRVQKERRAVQSALRHLAPVLSDRHRVFGTEVRIAKTSGRAQRTLAVLVLDYARPQTTEVVMDATGKVVETIDLQGFQPAFVAEEVEEARAIAEVDGRVARAARARGLIVMPFGPDRRRGQRNRLVGLRYAAVGRQEQRVLVEAVVDLTSRKLSAVRAFTREE
jgi:hypothetical protein